MTDSSGTADVPEQPDQPPPGYPRRPSATPPTQLLPASDEAGQVPRVEPPGQPGWVEPPGQPGWVPPPPPPPPRPPAPSAAWPPAPAQAPAGRPAGAPPQAASGPPLAKPPPPPSPPSRPGPPEGWAQPGPNYAPASYQPAPGWGPTSAAAPVVRRRNLPDLAAVPAPLLASLAISVGIVVLFVANLLIALGEPTGTAGNIRLLQFLSPADLAVAAILVVAVALVAVFRPATTTPEAAVEATIPGPAPGEALLRHENIRMVAGFVAMAVATGALVRAIVVLTIGHQHVVVKLGNMIDALAAVLVASVAAYWALKRGNR